MFTLFQSICGALLIQFATTSFLYETGKTTGFSSIVYNAVFHPGTYSWSVIVGLLASTQIVNAYFPQYIPTPPSAPIWYSCLSGLLVGIGTSWGSGCTSGHMLCGLSLLRLRSLVATMVFSAAAMAVVNIFDLAPSCGDFACSEFPKDENKHELFTIGVAVTVGFFVSKMPINRAFSGFKNGVLFGLGLFISGMADPAKPLGFLSIFRKEKFDPSLAMIMVFAVLPNIIEWQMLLKTESKPRFENKFSLPSATEIPMKFLIGCAIFGVGWGMHGTCPGPGILNAIYSYNGIGWLGSFIGGYALAKRI